ncbi:hypothetical protein H0266_15245 [Halobacillus locisalis]|uniref:Uncharacterized protein n=1 Tax=Halobacillus locisalis TaxID=220753 RepID=A0A838CVS6_9BACI|nr:hypothetical protein [Halobacillus locisalis]MBA2176252.1 hypothetical protein [Halobacillus locisalis]
MTKEKFFKTIAIVSFLFCVAVWVPNIVFQTASPWWILTFIVAPIGILSASLVKHYRLIVSNVIMLFSFPLFMFGGYLLNYIIDGKP